MSAHLDRLVSEARAEAPAWDAERSSRILAGAVGKREARARRDRFVRRGLVVASGAAVVVLMFIRSASSAAPSHESSASIEPASHAEPIAARALDDGGYGRD